jgi:hypothetical protein
VSDASPFKIVDTGPADAPVELKDFDRAFWRLCTRCDLICYPNRAAEPKRVRSVDKGTFSVSSGSSRFDVSMLSTCAMCRTLLVRSGHAQVSPNATCYPAGAFTTTWIDFQSVVGNNRLRTTEICLLRRFYSRLEPVRRLC